MAATILSTSRNAFRVDHGAMSSPFLVTCSI